MLYLCFISLNHSLLTLCLLFSNLCEACFLHNRLAFYLHGITWQVHFMFYEQSSQKVHHTNLYLEISQAEKKKGFRPSAVEGRTVRTDKADHPLVWCGPSARVGGARGGTGGSRVIYGPSVGPADRPCAPRPSMCPADCPQVHRELSTRAACRWGRGSKLLSQQAYPFLLKPDQSPIYFLLSCS
jgi:hypothetical protein